MTVKLLLSLLHYHIRIRWYRMRCWMGRSIINEELTQALHPEFGWFWGPEGEGSKYMREAYQQGIQEGRVQTMMIVDDCALVNAKLLQTLLEQQQEIERLKSQTTIIIKPEVVGV